MIKRLFIAVTAFFMFFTVIPVNAEILPLKEDDFEYELEEDDEGYEILLVYHACGGVFIQDYKYFASVTDDGSKAYSVQWVETESSIDDDEGEAYDWYAITNVAGTFEECVTRDGYKFKGWYYDEECTQKLEHNKENESFPKKLYLYAKWTEFKPGWEKTDDGWIYNVSESEIYKNGIYTIGPKMYGFDKNGIMVTGWYKYDGDWYYFTSSGAMVTGWKKIGGKWYYMESYGRMLKGWQKISGKWYYFGSSGAMLTGWQKIAKKWYYFTSGGAMVTGWKKIGGKWYYFQSSGVMKTGWLKLGGKWYYFTSSGAMVTGTRKIGSKTYEFSSSGACLNP
ncbi:MAG: hypothetical protein K6G61_11765 [Solobacterium sp.]|nr:hypothetical protein [Solobacterium sp.]